MAGRLHLRSPLGDERGQALVFVLVSMVVITVGLFLATESIVMEFGSARDQQARNALQDVTDGATGAIVNVAQPATLPLDSSSTPDMLQFVSAADNECHRIWIDRTADQVLSGSAPTCGELPGTARVLASRVTNGSDQPLFTYYSSMDGVTGEMLSSDFQNALSADINLVVAATAASGGGMYKASYHMPFGGAITTREIADSAVGVEKLADPNLIQSTDRIAISDSDRANYAGGEAGTWRSNATSAAVPNDYTFEPSNAYTSGGNCPSGSHDMGIGWQAASDSSEITVKQPGATVAFCSPPTIGAVTIPSGEASVTLYATNASTTTACTLTATVSVDGAGTSYAGNINVLPHTGITPWPADVSVLSPMTLASGDKLVVEISTGNTASCGQTTFYYGGGSHPSNALMPGDAFPAGDADATITPVAWADYCLTGRSLRARAVYTLYKPVGTSDSFAVTPRLLRFTGPTVSTSPSGGTPEFTGNTVTLHDGDYGFSASPWAVIDDGTCDGSYTADDGSGPWTSEATLPYWYRLQTNASATTTFLVVQAGIEYEYGPRTNYGHIASDGLAR